MAATGNGTNSIVQSAALSAIPLTYSYAFWYKPFAAALNGTPQRIPFGMASVETTTYNANYHVAFVWSFNSGTVYKAALHRLGGAPDYICQIQGTPPAPGVWVHIAVVFTGSALRLYLNGVLNNSVSASNLTVTQFPKLSVLAYANSNIVDFDNGSMSTLTVWNTPLTDLQVKDLGAAAVNPLTIANANIISHFPMNADSDETIGPNFVSTATTYNKTFFDPIIGGPAIGGHMPAPIFYTNDMAGGLAFGGANLVPKSIYNIPMSGGLVMGGKSVDDFVLTGNGSFVMREKRGSSEVKR